MSREAVARAQALLDVGRADEAAAILATAVAADPGRWRTWCVLGLAHLKCTRYRDALDCARHAIELSPGEEWPHRIASIAERQLGNHDRAVAAAREAVRLAPHEAYAHVQLAAALSKARPWRPVEPLHEAARAVELRPHDARIHNVAGDVALALHRTKLAATRYRRALELDPSNSSAMNNLALIRLRRGLPIAAVNGFSRAAALDPRTDLHRRNIDVAVRHALSYGAVLLGAVAVVDFAMPIAEGAALAAALAAAGVFLTKARRTVGPAGWAYARRVPFTNGGAALASAIVAVQVCLLAPVPFVDRHSPSQLAAWPVFLGARSLLVVVFRVLRT